MHAKNLTLFRYLAVFHILSWIAGSAAFVGLVLEVVRPLSQAQVLLL